jgi:hypothetical protein
VLGCRPEGRDALDAGLVHEGKKGGQRSLHELGKGNRQPAERQERNGDAGEQHQDQRLLAGEADRLGQPRPELPLVVADLVHAKSSPQVSLSVRAD